MGELIRNEAEAIDCLKKNRPSSGFYMLQESVDMAIQAIEEIQEYRAIGTVEEIKKVVRFLSSDDDNSIIDDLNLLNEYLFIGTVSEFRELKGKATAKKPTDVRYFGEAGYYIGLCPTCKSGNNSEYEYCGDCGQKLQWFERSEGKERI